VSINLLYSVKEGFLMLRRARLATTISITIVSMSIILFGVFLILSVNLQRIVQTFKTRMTIEVFMDNSLSQDEISGLERQILETEGVESVEFISQEKAMQRFRKDFGEEMVDILGDHSLPASFLIRLDSPHQNYNQSKQVVQILESHRGVDEVVYHGRLFQFVDRYSRSVIVVDLFILVLVLLTTIVLVSNTIRLTIIAQSRTIQIMKLVGATSGFVRRPYIVQGLLHGGIGGLIATAILWIFLKLIALRLPGLLTVSSVYLLMPLCISLILGFIGSVVGLRRFLRA